MTDAQLSLLLYQYAMRLSALLDAAETELPDEAKATTECPPFLPAGLHRARQYTPALGGLYDFAEELRKDALILEQAVTPDRKAGQR